METETKGASRLARTPAALDAAESLHLITPGDPSASVTMSSPGGRAEAVTIEIAGVLCTYTVGFLGPTVHELAQTTEQPVALDLAKVSFMDGRGAALILTLHRTITQQGLPCHLVRCLPQARRLLRIVAPSHPLLL